VRKHYFNGPAGCPVLENEKHQRYFPFRVCHHDDGVSIMVYLWGTSEGYDYLYCQLHRRLHGTIHLHRQVEIQIIFVRISLFTPSEIEVLQLRTGSFLSFDVCRFYRYRLAQTVSQTKVIPAVHLSKNAPLGCMQE
jgi:hypothetical protein